MVSICMVAAVSSLALSTPSAAQEKPLTISLSKGGFMLYAKKDTWRQQSVTATNRTESPRKLTVVYTTTDPEKGAARFTRTLTVPPRSSRSIELFVRMGELVQTGSKIGRFDAAAVAFELLDTKTGRKLDFGNDTASVIPADSTLIAFVTTTSDENESRVYLMAMPGEPLDKVCVIDPPLPTYPDRWFGYDMADIVMVGGQDFDKLRPSQIQAVLDWTSRGGVLVLRGGAALPDILAAGFAEAAGVEAVGYHRTISLDVSEASGRQVAKVTLPKALQMAEIAPTEAEVLYTANGLPLLTRHRYGQGWVFTLATPTAGLKDEKLQQLWKVVYKACNTFPVINDTDFAAPTLAALEQIAGRKAPGRNVPMTMLLVMAGATVLAGLILRRKRVELLWVAMVPTAVIIGVILYMIGVWQTDPQRLSYVGVISGLDENKVSVKGAFAYYSGPDNRKLDVRAGNGLTLIQDAAAGQIGALTLTRTQCGSQLSLPDVSLPPNSIRTFLLDGIATMPPIQADLTFGPDGAVGTITNNTDVDVQDAVIYINRRCYKVGDLPAGETGKVTLKISDLLAQGKFSGKLASSIGDKLRNAMLHEMTTSLNNHRKHDNRPVLIAHAPIMPLEPLAGRELTRQGWSILVWPVEITPPPADTQIVMPSGFVETVIKPLGVLVYKEQENTFLSTYRPTELLLLVGSPAIADNLTDATIKLVVGINAPTCRMVVAGRDGNKYTTIKSFTGPVGLLPEIKIPNAERFLNANGQYEISIKIEKPAGSEDLALWQFRSIDVSLEGKTR